METLNGLRILVVDDNRTNRRILQGILKRWGAQTTCAEGGEQALSELVSACKAEHPYQLVLTDMNMPEMDGFALVEQIRRNPELSPVNVMMLTSAGHRGDVGALPRAGNSVLIFTSRSENGNCLQRS